MDDAIAMAFGRLERSVERVEDKVDSMNDQLGRTVAEHGVRLTHVEQSAAEDRKRGFGMKDKLVVAAVTLVGSGAVSWIVSVITDKA